MRILRHKDLTPWNTLSLPARAKALLRVTDNQVLPEALAWSTREGMPLVPIGQGSNIVLAGDLEALVVRMETRGICVVAERDDSVDCSPRIGNSLMIRRILPSSARSSPTSGAARRQ